MPEPMTTPPAAAPATAAPVIRARGLSKRYGATQALDDIDLEIGHGRVVGLIGPNGAGKSSLLSALLGLTGYRGTLSVLGHDPRRHRRALMDDVAFIADVATLPRWLRIDQAITLVEALHPRFSRARCEQRLAASALAPRTRIGRLSKGMTVQLHLALVMAIDARLLILDEPTLGLDLLFRRRFYQALIDDYADADRTLLIATHQIEEIAHLLTDVIFIDRGRKRLDLDMPGLAARFVELHCSTETLAAARAAAPLAEHRRADGHALIYDLAADDAPDRARLAAWGPLSTPALADLFTACMTPTT